MSFEDWEKVKLEDIIEITMGQSPKSEYYNTDGKGLPFLQGNRTFGEKFPYFDTYCTENKKIAEKNDVMMSVRAPVGDLNIAQTRISIGRGVCAMRLIDSNKNNNYLFYLMKHNIKKMINRERGTVFGSVNRKDILGLDLTVTKNIIEQKAIAKILSSLDEKIEVNNQISETLENMAQAVFKEWFVDFEFPNENGEPYKSSGGEMVKCNLGLIPERWIIGSFESLGEIVSGATPSKKKDEYFTDNGISWITPKDLSNNKNKYIKNGATDITEDGLKNSSAKLMPKGAVLFSSRAPIGYIAIAGCEVSTNQGFKSVIPYKNFSSEYIYQELKNKTELIISHASGSTFKEISGKGLKAIPIVIPSKKILKGFNELVKPISISIKEKEEETEILKKLRDTLLPKLMSGEIRVPIDETEESVVQ